MNEELIARNSLTVGATAVKVWDVLVQPRFIRQWDELPEGFGDTPLDVGREIVWSGSNGNFTRLTVTDAVPYKRLRLALHTSSWEDPPEAYDIAYTYTLEEQDGLTRLRVAIGDFAPLPDGRDYYEASANFAAKALLKIKELAES